MAANIDSQRQRLMEQVLEYWYTTDFLSQGALHTEQTRRDKEGYAFVMSHPIEFGSLYAHTFLQEGESILGQIRQIEEQIKVRRKQEREKRREDQTDAPCCHGRITVYVGSINRAYLSLRIAELLGCDPPGNPSADRIALASFQLSDEGKYIKGSISLSPILWAVQRTADREENQSMYEVLDPAAYHASLEKYELNESQEMTAWRDIQTFAERIIEDTVVPLHADRDEEADVLPDIHYCFSIYRNEEERERRETEEYYGLSMSFYAEDLAGFKKALESGLWRTNPMWNALADYICAPYDMVHGEEKLRKDLSINALREGLSGDSARAELRRILAVDQTPMGKWPSRYQPFLMQQVAINLAINTKQPIFPVNGPPGTGKTTLLREIVADNVVRRALVLAQLQSPDDMFETREFKIGEISYEYYSFNPQMKEIWKYGIVVASSNNAAVENISKQLPLVESMERNIRDSGNSEIEAVHDLFSLDYAEVEVVRRKNFNKEGKPYEPVRLQDIYFSSYASELLREPCWGLISAPLGRRGNVVSFYNKVIKPLYWDFFRYTPAKFRLPKYQKARIRFLEQYEVVRKLRKDLQNQVAEAERRNQTDAGAGEDHFICLSDDFLRRLSSENPEERKNAQMANPRLTARYDREREKLFHAALKMTKEFIMSSERCRKNLTLLPMAWNVERKDNLFDKVGPEEREAIFRLIMTPLIQTLQLLVPVISTTFASAGRFFRYVTKLDALGTIIVDEAGQSTPQMALRLFSKASRAIVVGDPNQITPVVSDELAFLESTLDQTIGDVYSDKTMSVQKIADYLSIYGGTQRDILGAGGRQWIGVPLYVHSRCIEPMFSISNRLSYGNAMLRITGEPEEAEKASFCFQASQWINVSGEEEKQKNHFVRAQGERVLRILETAFAENAKKTDPSREAGPDLFIISPFHTVAEGMRQLLSTSLGGQYPVLAANREMVENWIIDEQNPHIGTVHTFQGREAKEVIFLLGCDEHSRKSANWVNRNIVNVAVSRARYRLYVVGDVKVWDQCDPVMEMKYDLDAYAFDALAAIAGADSTWTPTDAAEIPQLPSAEMFEIEAVTDNPLEEEYTIGTDSALNNLRAYVPGFGTDFSEQELEIFGLHSMDEFQTLFSDKVQGLLRAGMWNYLWLRSCKDEMSPNYDVSAVAIYFCKAFEQILRENYFKGLKKLIPDTMVKGKMLSEADVNTFMIGDYTTVISLRQLELSRQMMGHGYSEMDYDWWGGLLEKLRNCKNCRNCCCHPGETFTWEQLEYLLNLLFKDSLVFPVRLGGKEFVIHGLMLDRTFKNATEGSFKRRRNTDLPENADGSESDSGQVVREYMRISSKARQCPKDKNALIHKACIVRKKDGKVKKMNMLYCKACGRKYVDVTAQPNSVHMEEYDLTEIPIG